MRELLLRDLGGFVLRGPPQRGHLARRPSRASSSPRPARLDAVDAELRELEARLGEPHAGETVVREPGIGGTCPACGELHASDAGSAAHCGTPLTDRARRRRRAGRDREIAARRERDAERAARARAERAEAQRAASPAAAPLNGEPATAGDARDEPSSPVRGDDADARSEDAATQGERGR